MAALKKKSASKGNEAKHEPTGPQTVSIEDIQYWDMEINDVIPQDVINRGIIQSAYKGKPMYQFMLGLAFLPFSKEHAEIWLKKAAENNDTEAHRLLGELADADSGKYIIIWWSTRNFSNSVGSPRISILNRATDRSLNKYVYRNAIVMPFSVEDEECYDECFKFIRDNIDDQIIPASDIICEPLAVPIEDEEDSIFEDFEVDLANDEGKEELYVEMEDDDDLDDEEPKFNGGVEGMLKLGFDMNDPFRQYDYGMTLFSIDKDPEGIKWILKAAKNGYTEAEAMVGQLYLAGNSLPEDIGKAIKYLNRAAQKGHAEAQYVLACCYLNDDNPQYSVNEGEHWLALAAEQGNADAQYLLGCHYLDEDNSRYSVNKGEYWLTSAANQGNADAQYLLGCRYLDDGNPQYSVENGEHWLTLAAEQGNAEAQYMLGCWYFNDENPHFSIDKAEHWLDLAANQNSPEAQCLLGICFLNDKNPKFSIDKAEYWLGLAANQDNEDAIELLNKLTDPTKIPCEITWWSLKEFGTDGNPICSIDWDFDFNDGVHAKNQTKNNITCKEFIKLKPQSCLYDYIRTRLDPEVLKDREMKIEEIEE